MNSNTFPPDRLDDAITRYHRPGVPRKVRQIISDLERAGFVNRGGKGSHRNFVNARGVVVTVSGKPGDDVPHYLEKQLRLALRTTEHENR